MEIETFKKARNISDRIARLKRTLVQIEKTQVIELRGRQKELDDLKFSLNLDRALDDYETDIIYTLIEYKKHLAKTVQDEIIRLGAEFDAL